MLWLCTLLFTALSVLSFDSRATIYGTNDLQEVENVADAKIQTLARSVAVQVRKKSTQFLQNKNFRTLKDSLVCESEPFVDQPVLGTCTGVLVDPEHILTAGHCYMGQNNPCADTEWIFDYTLQKATGPDVTEIIKNTYQCESIVKISYLEGLDYTLIKLKTSVTDREPLVVSAAPGISAKEVFALHSPRGLPLKYSTGHVRSQDQANSFVTTLDLLRGSSGAPVFDSETLEVIGLVSNGDTDYELLEEPFCNIYKVCPEDGCRGETITRTSRIPLKQLLKK